MSGLQGWPEHLFSLLPGEEESDERCLLTEEVGGWTLFSEKCFDTAEGRDQQLSVPLIISKYGFTRSSVQLFSPFRLPSSLVLFFSEQAETKPSSDPLYQQL